MHVYTTHWQLSAVFCISGISAQHLSPCGELFNKNLVLLYKMIFNPGFVPHPFSFGCLTPIPKKSKSPSECSSFCPITVTTLFANFFCGINN